MTWKSVAAILLSLWILLFALLYQRLRNLWRNPARYSQAFNQLESANPSERMKALHEILDPIDFPLADVKRQTRIAIGILLTDEDATVRRSAALRLSGVALTVHDTDFKAFQR